MFWKKMLLLLVELLGMQCATGIVEFYSNTNSHHLVAFMYNIKKVVYKLREKDRSEDSRHWPWNYSNLIVLWKRDFRTLVENWF